MKKMVRDEKYIETVRIHRSELKNIVFKDHGKEFLYNGEMYDIKEIKTEGDHIVFRCINDKTEKKLLAGLKEQIKNNGGTDSSSEKKQNDTGKNTLKDLFCIQNELFGIEYSENIYPTISFTFIALELSPLPSPPPELVHS